MGNDNHVTNRRITPPCEYEVIVPKGVQCNNPDYCDFKREDKTEHEIPLSYCGKREFVQRIISLDEGF